MTIGDKLKDAKAALTGNKSTNTTHDTTPTLFNTHGGTVDGAAGTTCVPGTTPSSTPSTGVAYQEAETTKTTTTGAQATCGQEFFSKVEDRPREYIKEHHPVDKEFVVETRFVGERELQEGRTTEVLGTEEHIVGETQPKAPCE